MVICDKELVTLLRFNSSFRTDGTRYRKKTNVSFSHDRWYIKLDDSRSPSRSVSKIQSPIARVTSMSRTLIPQMRWTNLVSSSCKTTKGHCGFAHSVQHSELPESKKGAKEIETERRFFGLRETRQGRLGGCL
ncbi:hypothetical protein K0M31_002437 [Melipona bicolor]|uniref:Uncharacterized protein n=1 Tax=Melipona bicolor TaxID=60889 RepID=A0AA40KYN1_9HYME|nr:hypothetical protein K0M31_002437 [Melipona bicolor]